MSRNRVQRRLPDELFVEDFVDAQGLGRTLDVARAPMVRLGLIANYYRQLTSQQFLSEFGIGATDWRMLVVLIRTPGLSVGGVSALVGLDKALVSRSLTGLRNKGLAVDEAVPADKRQRKWKLTTQGRQVHDSALSASLDLNRAVLTGFDESDVASLVSLLDRMLVNLETVTAGSDDLST